MEDLKKEYENIIDNYAKSLKEVFEVIEKIGDFCVDGMKEVCKVFEQTVNVYIKAFEIKQELHFDDWAEDFIVADFGGTDFYSIDDIRHDIDTKQPAGQIIAWNEAVLLNNEKHGFINYKNWCKGANYSLLMKNKNDRIIK